MAEQSSKLLEALKALRALQVEDKIVVRTEQLSRTHRERLCKHGFLQKVINGWYIPSRPNEPPGESTAWYTSFWQFCATYLSLLKGRDWCLSPEQSIFLHVGNWTIPKQLLVRSPKAHNNITELLHGTSLFITDAALQPLENRTEINNIQIYSLPAALCACTARFFSQNPNEGRAALMMISDASQLLHLLLAGGHSVIAGRLAGAFRNIGKAEIADELVATMIAADYSVHETDPFLKPSFPKLQLTEQRPHVNRMQLLWQEMRPTVLGFFPEAPGIPDNKTAYLDSIKGLYTNDAYHSLSIEGYQVTEGLIEQVQSGNWDASADHKNRNALAARGYWQAFQRVQSSIRRILDGENPGQVTQKDHRSWCREMFAPNVAAGIIEASHLAGYRNAPVYIRQSMHIPPSCGAVRDLMPTLFELLSTEKEPAVRTVLGHFMFVYIHPYMDGNGRMGRFLMNSMLASGGYPWTVIPLEKRKNYMEALEQASVDKNIGPFTQLLAQLIEN